MVGGGDPFYLKFWINRRKLTPILNRYSLVAPQCYGWKSSVNTNRKIMSLRWSSYVAPKPPKGGSETQNGRFPSKIVLRLKKVCYKVSLCENCLRQSCKAFIGLTIRAKWFVGQPLYLKFWIKLTALERSRRFSISFRS